MKNKDIIDMLGGIDYVAERLGISKNAVYLWFYEGQKGKNGIIPANRAITIYRWAQEKGIDCTLEDVLGYGNNS